MALCPYTLFSSKDDFCKKTTSSKIRVGCGEYAKIVGYCLPEGVCINIVEVYDDPCRCIYFEQPYCEAGGQVGIDCDNPRAEIPMPGCYFAEICVDDPTRDFSDEEFHVTYEICSNVENLSTVIHARCATECN